MSIVVENKFGWVLDHRKATKLDDCRGNVPPPSEPGHDGAADGRSRPQLTCCYKRDLFRIDCPYRMDSQVKDKAGDTETCGQDGRNTRKRKPRKRKLPMTEGQILAQRTHEMIRSDLLAAYECLLDLARGEKYFHEPDSDCNDDNNAAARAAARAPDPGQNLAELCHNYVDLWKNRVFCFGEDSYIPATMPVNQVWKYTGDVPRLVHLSTGCYIVPPRAAFLLSCMSLLPRQPFYKDSYIPATMPVNQVWKYTGAVPRVVHLSTGCYIVPPRAAFLLSCMSFLPRQPFYKALGQFDLIVMDPPWENRSVKRKKTYYSAGNHELTHLPIQHLCRHGCLVVVWATNRQKQIDFVYNSLFPTWNVRPLAKWYWIKVTTSGEMVYQFDSPHKKPYETIILGCFQGTEYPEPNFSNTTESATGHVDKAIYNSSKTDTMNMDKASGAVHDIVTDSNATVEVHVVNMDRGASRHGVAGDNSQDIGAETSTNNCGIAEVIPRCNIQDGAATDTDAETCTNNSVPAESRPGCNSNHGVAKDTGCCNQLGLIPDGRVIVSVPCSIHSKKPPLFDVLKSHLPPSPDCLEMFARNLLPGWTSVGNEVLEHQLTLYFESVG